MVEYCGTEFWFANVLCSTFAVVWPGPWAVGCYFFAATHAACLCFTVTRVGGMKRNVGFAGGILGWLVDAPGAARRRATNPGAPRGLLASDDCGLAACVVCFIKCQRERRQVYGTDSRVIASTMYNTTYFDSWSRKHFVFQGRCQQRGLWCRRVSFVLGSTSCHPPSAIPLSYRCWKCLLRPVRDDGARCGVRAKPPPGCGRGALPCCAPRAICRKLILGLGQGCRRVHCWDTLGRSRLTRVLD